MTRYNKNNPVPSNEVKDFSDNAQIVDEIVHLQQTTTKDRFGKNLKTWYGVQQDANEAISQYGYITLDSFEDGNTLTLPNQVLRLEATGEYYRWDGVLPKVVPANSTPESTGGIGPGVWLGIGDASLRAELGSPGGVNLVNGAAKQEDVDILNKQNLAFSYIEDYSNLVSNDDWSEAIQAAFDTGKPVVGLGGKSYKATKIINTKGQQTIGNWSVNTTRYSLGMAPADSIVDNSGLIRMIYISSAYDYTEMLHIKSLGANTIAHYCFWQDNPEDAEGTVVKLLNNAQSSGLKVLLGTEGAEASSDLSSFIRAYESHPAVMGFSVYDEPATRGITVAQQNTKISTMRPLTGKALTVVDLAPPGGPFEQKFSTNYDIVFVDSYSLRYGSGTVEQNIAKDLNKMRYDFGIVKAMTSCSRVIPVISTFIDIDPSGIYSQVKAQIIPASDLFSIVGKGEFGAFVWDNYVGPGSVPTGQLRDDADFKALVRRASSQVIRKELKTDVFIFGGGPGAGATQWPLTELLNSIQVKDTSTSMGNAQRNSYPVKVVTGASETDRTTTTAGQTYSGIGFKGADAGFVSGLVFRKNLRAHVELFTTGPTIAGTFNIKTTNDAGYSANLIYAAATSGNTVFDISSADGGYGDTLIFEVANPGDISTLYRKFLRGIVINSDW